MTGAPPTETIDGLPEPATVPLPLPPGARLAGRYLLGEVLGAGGYGVVYRAVDERSGDVVAVKALRAERLSASGRQRLQREASLLAGLEHPHLVKVLGAGESDGVAYLTMELVEGEPLRERLLRGPLGVEESVRLAREVLAGLAALHAQGIVHRDVKPGNVLLDATGSAKLADFGLVRRFDADATRATSSLAVVGTAEYLSPEQALGEELDGRSDLYSLGVVLFEMLAGRPVHERRSTFATVLARLSEAAPDLRELRAEIPAWLAAVVGRLLEKEPGRRYASAEEALADLGAGRMPRGALRRRLLRRGLVAGAAAALGVAVAVGWAWEHQRGGFDRIEVEGDRQVVALDHAGRVLWKRQGATGRENFLPIRTLPDGGVRIAAVLAGEPEAYAPEVRHRLALLDPETGAVREEVTLPSAAGSFPEIEDRYGLKMRAFDLDGDTVDELLVSYQNASSWPSFTVLYEPRQRRARVVYLAGGHQHPVGAADVDGDGRAELVFAGTANRQGWYAAVGVVPVRPWLNEPSSRTAGAALAATPEEDRVGENALLWYALLPRGFIASDPALEVDPARRTLTVRYQHGGRAILSFDGFLVDEPAGALAPAARRAGREAAYASLRAAQRLQGGGYLDEALARTRLAVSQAESASDSRLREWAERVKVSVLIARGDVAEAEALAERLVSVSEAAPEIAFDTARALHLRGAAEEAAGWYRRGLGPGSSRASGRRAWEFVEGAVLALAGLGRFAEAERVVERQLAAVPDELNLNRLDLEWCRLRRGATPQRERVPVVEAQLASDFGFFALAELDLATGRPPEEVLAAVDRFRPKAVEEDFFVDWARAEALLRLGRTEEAREALHRALERAERAARTTPSAVSALPLLRLRLTEI